MISLKLTTPEAITPAVNDFNKKLTRGVQASRPMFVPVKPYPEAEPHKCFINCATAVALKKPPCRMVYGWIIWQCTKSKILSAEFHSVLKVGALFVDPTPQPDGEKQIVFVWDMERKPEFSPDFSQITRFNNFEFFMDRPTTITHRIDPADAAKMRALKRNPWL